MEMLLGDKVTSVLKSLATQGYDYCIDDAVVILEALYDVYDISSLGNTELSELFGSDINFYDSTMRLSKVVDVPLNVVTKLISNVHSNDGCPNSNNAVPTRLSTSSIPFTISALQKVKRAELMSTDGVFDSAASCLVRRSVYFEYHSAIALEFFRGALKMDYSEVSMGEVIGRCLDGNPTLFFSVEAILQPGNILKHQETLKYFEGVCDIAGENGIILSLFPTVDFEMNTTCLGYHYEKLKSRWTPLYVKIGVSFDEMIDSTINDKVLVDVNLSAATVFAYIQAGCDPSLPIHGLLKYQDDDSSIGYLEVITSDLDRSLLQLAGIQ